MCYSLLSFVGQGDGRTGVPQPTATCNGGANYPTCGCMKLGLLIGLSLSAVFVIGCTQEEEARSPEESSEYGGSLLSGLVL